MHKRELRAYMRKLSAKMPEHERQARDAQICRRLLALPEYSSAQSIFIYISSGDEVSTKELVDKMLSDNKRIFAPHCYGNGVMDAVRLFSTSELSRGLYGLFEPPSNNPRIQPQELDLIIVPAVAFAYNGARLGRGGGYYDRYIDRANGVKTIGICRENNFLPSMDTEAHDKYVDIIITEKQTVKSDKKEEGEPR